MFTFPLTARVGSFSVQRDTKQLVQSVSRHITLLQYIINNHHNIPQWTDKHHVYKQRFKGNVRPESRLNLFNLRLFLQHSVDTC